MGEASAATAWKLRLDTWRFPDGGYTLTTVGILPDGRRSVPDRSYLHVHNVVDSLCPAS